MKMRNREIEERLRRETEAASPDVYENVVRRCGISTERPADAGRPERRDILLKRVLPALAVAAVAIIVVVLGAVLGAAPVPTSTFLTVEVCGTDGEGAAAASADSEGSGPSISFTADSRNVIDSVRANNNSGKVVLMDSEIKRNAGRQTALKGRKLREGAGILASVFVKLGYVGEKKDVYIRITAAGDEKKKAERLGETVSREIGKRLKKENVSVDVKTGLYDKENLKKLAEESGRAAGETIAEIIDELAERKDYVAEKVDKLKEDARKTEKKEEDAVYDAMREQLHKDVEERLEDADEKTKEALENLKAKLEEDAEKDGPDKKEQDIEEILRGLGFDTVSFETGSFEIPETFEELAAFMEKAAEKRAEELAGRNEKSGDDSGENDGGRKRKTRFGR